MSDLIDRHAAIKTVRKAKSKGEAHRMLVQLPSAQPRWIPCSEGYPEHRVYVLVAYKPVYGIPDIGITWYSKSEEKWNTSREVLAWMPLPKPYEGERDDNT